MKVLSIFWKLLQNSGSNYKTHKNIDDFVVDTVVSSSELLSDISDSNVITFGESHESLQPNTSNQVNHVIVTAGIFVVSLLALVSLVR